MAIEQTLQNEIQESTRWIDLEKENSTYKRDLQKRIELINWVLEKMNDPNFQICDLIESKMNQIILAIKVIIRIRDIFPIVLSLSFGLLLFTCFS
jgi:hypothetical protein